MDHIKAKLTLLQRSLVLLECGELRLARAADNVEATREAVEAVRSRIAEAETLIADAGNLVPGP